MDLSDIHQQQVHVQMVVGAHRDNVSRVVIAHNLELHAGLEGACALLEAPIAGHLRTSRHSTSGWRKVLVRRGATNVPPTQGWAKAQP